jgi:hypothetical protein
MMMIYNSVGTAGVRKAADVRTVQILSNREIVRGHSNACAACSAMWRPVSNRGGHASSGVRHVGVVGHAKRFGFERFYRIPVACMIRFVGKGNSREHMKRITSFYAGDD